MPVLRCLLAFVLVFMGGACANADEDQPSDEVLKLEAQIVSRGL